MQLSYVFSELATGLRRNVSMTVAVVVTIFVSLTLVGMGYLLNAQAQKAEEYWGDRLQITVFMCSEVSTSASCVDGRATAQQERAVAQALDDNPEVETWRKESSRQAYQKWRETRDADDPLLQSMRASDFPESFWVTLQNPENVEAVSGAVQDLPGVGSVRDLRQVLQPIYFWISALKYGAIGVAAFLLVAAVLQVGNTIRLAAYARRKEIGIMRLVGASSIYIQLPFLLESLVAAVLGIALASGAIAAFLQLVVNDRLADSNIVAWVDWSDALAAMGLIAALGLLLTLLPTLLLTRRYLKV
jgi:cell division transport system permease protein